MVGASVRWPEVSCWPAIATSHRPHTIGRREPGLTTLVSAVRTSATLSAFFCGRAPSIETGGSEQVAIVCTQRTQNRGKMAASKVALHAAPPRLPSSGWPLPRSLCPSSDQLCSGWLITGPQPHSAGQAGHKRDGCLLAPQRPLCRRRSLAPCAATVLCALHPLPQGASCAWISCR